MIRLLKIVIEEFSYCPRQNLKSDFHEADLRVNQEISFNAAGHRFGRGGKILTFENFEGSFLLACSRIFFKKFGLTAHRG
jgi:hypothetical protein